MSRLPRSRVFSALVSPANPSTASMPETGHRIPSSGTRRFSNPNSCCVGILFNDWFIKQLKSQNFVGNQMLI
jgi:hypothetical protein